MGQFKVLDRDSGENSENRSARYYDMLVWGEIYSPPKLSIREKDGKKRVNFGIRWKKHTFVNCVVIEQQDPSLYDTACRLKLGDLILAAGRLREFTYTPTKGKNAGKPVIGQDAKISFLVPQRSLSAIMDEMYGGELPTLEENLAEFDPELEDEPEW